MGEFSRRMQMPVPEIITKILKTLLFLIFFVLFFFFVALGTLASIDNSSSPLWESELIALLLSSLLGVGLYKIWKNLWIPASFLIIWSIYNLIDEFKPHIITNAIYIILFVGSTIFLVHTIIKYVYRAISQK